MPLTGMVVVNRAERAAECLTMLAEQNPRIARLLGLVAGSSAYVGLAMIVGDVVVAAGVERQAIPMDHPLASGIQPELRIVVRQMEDARQRAAAAQAQADARHDEPLHVAPDYPVQSAPE